MADFKEVLYESLLFGFGKVLAMYNTFAQDSILKDIGKEIIEYLNSHGFEFKEEGTLDDIPRLLDLFIKNGFSELEISPAGKGDIYKWHNLYGLQAYSELHKITENPFLSCPLNACLYYLADKHGKSLKLHSKTFNLENNSAESQEELVDKENVNNEDFDSLVIENKRLYEIAEKRAKALEQALNEVKILQGLLPICASCKKIRDEKGYWNRIETYIENHSDVQFTHSLCQECTDKLYGEEDWYKEMKDEREKE